jgi:hypothetical protein
MKAIVLVQQILCVVLFPLTFIGNFGNESLGSILEKTLVKFCNENFCWWPALGTYFRSLVGQLRFWAFKQNEQLSGYLVAQVWMMLDGQVNELENGPLYGHLCQVLLHAHFVHPSDSKSSSIPNTFSCPHAIWFVWPSSTVAYGQFSHWQNAYIYFSKNEFILNFFEIIYFSIIYYDIVMWIVKLFRM